MNSTKTEYETKENQNMVSRIHIVNPHRRETKRFPVCRRREGPGQFFCRPTATSTDWSWRPSHEVNRLPTVFQFEPQEVYTSDRGNQNKTKQNKIRAMINSSGGKCALEANLIIILIQFHCKQNYMVIIINKINTNLSKKWSLLLEEGWVSHVEYLES